MKLELRTGRRPGRHDVVVDRAESLGEALGLAQFYVDDPRDPKAPRCIFIWNDRLGQYCGWARQKGVE